MSRPVLAVLRDDLSTGEVPLAQHETKIDILIVDDDPRNVLALEAMLESLGQNIVAVQSGTDALRRLLDREFALILLDIHMPGLDGFETAQIIRARERSRDLPIIFLTAYSKDDVQVAHGYELGAVDFLFKPLVPLVLRSKVQVFVDLYRKTLEIKRQAVLLRDSEHREHDCSRAEAAQRVEALRLGEEVIKERAAAIERALLIGELSLRNHELASADRRKDEFLAMLAHELRNPMAPIVNAVEILRMPGPPEAVRTRALDALARQSRHMVRLLDDLLDLSRITSGKIELRREPVTLASIVAHAVQTSAPLFEQRGHRFASTIPDEDITLVADGTRLGQVVANLLDNAAKYSPPGTEIELVVELEANEVVIRVRDRGFGIDPAVLEEVFGLFVQAERTADRAQGGLGIGLTVVKRLVEMHGGSVRAQSAGLGQGSEFSVRLPHIAAPALVTPPAPDAPPAACHDCPIPPSSCGTMIGPTPRRVLVVEDNEDIGATMKDMLEYWGHDATIASDGPAGVEAVLSGVPDIAFIDIGLPGLDGYQVVAAVRARAPGIATRLVALTGYGRPEDRQRALAAGFDDHLVKPVSSDDLRRLIDACTPVALLHGPQSRSTP